jgi:hypothetical protein
MCAVGSCPCVTMDTTRTVCDDGDRKIVREKGTGTHQTGEKSFGASSFDRNEKVIWREQLIEKRKSHLARTVDRETKKSFGAKRLIEKQKSHLARIV